MDSGVIKGTVKDGVTRQPLGEVSVTTSSPADPDTHSVVTDDSGGFLRTDLPPGTYTVRCEKDGYQPFERHGIELRANGFLTIEVQLSPGSAET